MALPPQRSMLSSPSPTPAWVRLNGDMPEARFGSTAVPISPNQVFVVGGNNECGCTKTAFIGSITM